MPALHWTCFRLCCAKSVVESSWNVMTHGDAREGKWRGNWRMEWVASTLHATSEHGASTITTADAHTSAASSRLNWCPRRFKWTCPFRRKTKSGFCACAITFQTQFNTRSTQCRPWARCDCMEKSSILRGKLLTLAFSLKTCRHLHILCVGLARYKHKISSVTRRVAHHCYLTACMNPTTAISSHYVASDYFTYWRTAIIVYYRMPEAPGSNTGRDTGYPEFLHGLPQSLQTPGWYFDLGTYTPFRIHPY